MACQDCGKELEARTIGNRKIEPKRCAECAGRQAEERRRDLEGRREESAKREARRAWTVAMRGSGLPEPLRSDALEVRPELAAWLERDFPRRDCGIYLYGPTGTYKTRQAAALLRAYTRRRAESGEAPKVRYVNTVRLCESLRPSTSETVDVLALADADFLVLDDLGCEVATQKVGQRMYGIINQRAVHQRPTVITSNDNPVALAKLTDWEGRRVYQDNMIRKLAEEMCARGEHIHNTEGWIDEQ